MLPMQQYITVIKCKQMIPEPEGWRHRMTQHDDNKITYYKSKLIRGEKLTYYVDYEKDIISTVCDQEAADVYSDYVTLATGEQFYQFVNHVIKGLEYIKYLAQ